MAHNSFRPLAKVIFADAANTADKQVALFNPQEVSPSTEARYSNLEPHGFTGNPEQYGGTNSTTFSIKLDYSLAAFMQLGLGKHYANYYGVQAWFNSFLYPERPGFAPKRLIVIWKHTLTMITTVKSVSVEFRRWDPRLRVKDYQINLDLKETDQQFANSAFVRNVGYQRAVAPLIQLTGAPGDDESDHS